RAIIPKSQLDDSANSDEVVGLTGVPMPVGDSVGAKLHPVDLLRGNLDAVPILAKQLGHPSAAGEDIAKLHDLHAVDLGGRGPAAALQHALAVLFSRGVRHESSL